MTFSAYNNHDLQSILEDRLGSNLMDPKAIEFIAKTVANTGGDARKALELASKAVMNCYEGLHAAGIKKSKSSRDDPKPLVTLKHVLAIHGTQSKKFQDIIERLPEDGKAILCILSVLSQNSVTQTTYGRLRQFVTQCLDDGGKEALEKDEFQLLLETLRDSGLIRFGAAAAANKNNKKKSHNHKSGSQAQPQPGTLDPFQTPVCIGQQALDIDKAIQTVLGKVEFYAKLMIATKGHLKNFLGS